MCDGMFIFTYGRWLCVSAGLWRCREGTSLQYAVNHVNVCVRQSVGEGSTEERLKTAFSRIDKDNSGNISSDELREYIRSVGGALSDTDIDAAMKEIDKDGNGDVSFEGNPLIKHYLLHT